jgi:hypothetical protein
MDTTYGRAGMLPPPRFLPLSVGFCCCLLVSGNCLGVGIWCSCCQHVSSCPAADCGHATAPCSPSAAINCGRAAAACSSSAAAWGNAAAVCPCLLPLCSCCRCLQPHASRASRMREGRLIRMEAANGALPDMDYAFLTRSPQPSLPLALPLPSQPPPPSAPCLRPSLSPSSSPPPSPGPSPSTPPLSPPETGSRIDADAAASCTAYH